jgi:hypothetical protein
VWIEKHEQKLKAGLIKLKHDKSKKLRMDTAIVKND